MKVCLSFQEEYFKEMSTAMSLAIVYCAYELMMGSKAFQT